MRIHGSRASRRGVLRKRSFKRPFYFYKSDANNARFAVGFSEASELHANDANNNQTCKFY